MTSAQIDTIQALENEKKILANEVKMKEELIPGMEKMLAYLQKIQQENKKLKEENQELKERLEDEWIDPATVVQWEQAQVWVEELKKLKEENKKLKEEVGEMMEELEVNFSNEELMDEIEKWREWARNVLLLPQIGGIQIEAMKKQGLLVDKDDPEPMLGSTKAELEARKIYNDEIRKLKEEIKKLKDEYDGWKASYDDDIREVKGEKQQEIDELKEEMKEYKEYCDKWSQIIPSIDGDVFCDLLQECGWVYDGEVGDLVRVTDK